MASQTGSQSKQSLEARTQVGSGLNIFHRIDTGCSASNGHYVNLPQPLRIRRLQTALRTSLHPRHHQPMAFGKWTKVFGSERLTRALLDRLTRHAHILVMNGEIYRVSRDQLPNHPKID